MKDQRIKEKSAVNECKYHYRERGSWALTLGGGIKSEKNKNVKILFKVVPDLYDNLEIFALLLNGLYWRLIDALDLIMKEIMNKSIFIHFQRLFYDKHEKVCSVIFLWGCF